MAARRRKRTIVHLPAAARSRAATAHYRTLSAAESRPLFAAGRVVPAFLYALDFTDPAAEFVFFQDAHGYRRLYRLLPATA